MFTIVISLIIIFGLMHYYTKIDIIKRLFEISCIILISLTISWPIARYAHTNEIKKYDTLSQALYEIKIMENLDIKYVALIVVSKDIYNRNLTRFKRLNNNWLFDSFILDEYANLPYLTIN